MTTAPTMQISQCTDSELVESAIQAKADADAIESESSPSRWNEADCYAELSSRGWTQTRIANECETTQSTVSRFIACVKNHAVPHKRPSFWQAYQDVDGKKRAHVSNNSGENDWFTPAEDTEAARRVMGGIDLNPASNETANEVVGATHFFTIEDDELSRKWNGKVYLNPPYGKVIGDWVEKLIDEFKADNVTEAISLLPARTDTAWFNKLRDFPRCFIRGRLKFVAAEHFAPFPSVVVYLGLNTQRFIEVFGQLGDVFELAVPRPGEIAVFEPAGNSREAVA